MLLTHPWPIARPFIAGGVHTISLQFPRSLRKDRKYCACSQGFDLRAPENLCFGEQELIHARFSLSRTEPVPFTRAAKMRRESLVLQPLPLLRVVMRLVVMLGFATVSRLCLFRHKEGDARWRPFCIRC